MSLECLNDIIKDNLAIHIDLTDNKSWLNYNTGLTATSLTKWVDAVSDNINLMDFGLTEFDVGGTNVMWSGITVTPSDIYISMYPVGYNTVINPTTGETSGMTINTTYLDITGISTGDTSNYMYDLNGGYLQGYFKLEDYNYKILPTRYWKGITVETVLYLYPDSEGIFYMMGARAEDKYNPCFSGETMTGITNIYCSSSETTSGVYSSNDNFLCALMGEEVHKDSFIRPEDSHRTVYSETEPINNIKTNVIAFEITNDKHFAYKYIDGNGQIVTNQSTYTLNVTGLTVVDVVFRPHDIIYDKNTLECVERRLGKLLFYVNGRLVWTEDNFLEYYFRGFDNDGDKQIGVPYSISWGGGSFGLKNSWHYDYQTYGLYVNEDTTYVNNNFTVKEHPLNGTTTLSGITLSADTISSETAMKIVSTGATGNTYYIEFNAPISTLSNRDYLVNVSIYNDGIFRNSNDADETISNIISILPYSDSVDINILEEVEYMHPLLVKEYTPEELGLHPFFDFGEYQYVNVDGIMYYGETGLPVIDGLGTQSFANFTGGSTCRSVITGAYSWKNLKCIFRTEDNTGQNLVKIGILIETTGELNIDEPLYVKGFVYSAPDILVQEEAKDNQLIEQNFNIPFQGGIQKLRVYNNGLSSAEILHNALIESENKPNINISKGGRIIYT